MSIKEFRSINPVGCIYKLIAKVLAKRMIQVKEQVIGESQHAFVKDMQITDAVLVANEFVGDAIFRNRDGILCKLDMEKTLVMLIRVL